MSIDIIRLGANDFDEAMAFLNEVFGEHRPHDFAKMLPSIYQPTDASMRCNYAVRDGGRLGAIVGVFPIDWRVGGARLKVTGIGGVSVHPDSRGKGYMRLLMNHAVQAMRREGTDLSYLGGRRQRYAYFGYEVADTVYRLKFFPDNVRHTFKGVDPGVRFEPLDDDGDYMAELKVLHDSQPQYCERPADRFHHFLRSWHDQPSVARDQDGRVIGYVVAQRSNPVWDELVAADADAAAGMVCRWFRDGPEKLSVLMYPPAGRILRHLGGFAETVRVEPGGNWQIFNWVGVIDALMKSLHTASPMPDGEVIVGINDADVTLRLMVDDAGARCEAAGGGADLSVDTLTAVRLLFGPGSPSTVTDLPASASILSAWCPLPLGISMLDHV